MENNNAHNEIPAEFFAAVNCVVNTALHLKILAKRFADDFGEEKAEALLQGVAQGQFDILIPVVEEQIKAHCNEQEAEDFLSLMKEQLN
jgi:hypothetical protein